MSESEVLEQGLFDTQLARDARDRYDALLRAGVPVEAAVEAMLYEQRIVALMFPPQAALLWLSLAVTEQARGRRDETVRRRAAHLLRDEAWLVNWTSDEDELRRRRAACDVIRSLLDEDGGTPGATVDVGAQEVPPAAEVVPLTYEIREAIDRDLALIRDENPTTDFEGPSDPLIREVGTDIDRFAAMEDVDAEARREKMTGVLGLIWGEQLRRAGEWEWTLMRDAEGEQPLALVHRDRAAWVSPFNHIMSALHDPAGHRNVACELFEMIRDGRAPIGVSGTLISLNDVAERMADRNWPAQRDVLMDGRTAPELAASSMRAMLDALDENDQPAFGFAEEIVNAAGKLAEVLSGGRVSPDAQDDDPDEDEDDEPGDPPARDQVARRALILHHLVSHALAAMRLAVLPDSTPEDASVRQQVAREVAVESRRRLEALHAGGLWEDMSHEEHVFVEAQADDLDAFDVMQISWRAESLCCLLWACGLIDEIPPYDTQVEPELIIAMGQGETDLATMLGSAEPRSEDEIEHARIVAEMWHWRSRTRQLLEENHPFPPMPPVDGVEITSWDGVVRLTAPRAAEGGLIPPTIDDDFPAFGRAYRDLSTEEWSQAQSIAMERHLALNWLSGYAPENRWEDTPTET